ncbi:serine/threonine protein kinase [Pseudobutyrivibrio xylanivorans]|uniref:Serine/threonine protein kinase n=1 Tax=Pseudobutyrivibrio xylanivorans TaxID=185007 RepID=A0A1G5S5B8_PSEXY|nr:serine/threonine-protein kinase [Pseudobutyrivibrio xylanivorans]SCZ80729.1 serine/threonine protein kinase [Pseudobutyrivibrio xylanivorans]
MLEIGSVIDKKYKILNKIGQGGMSVVYLAMNERANKQWAIKEIRKDAAAASEINMASIKTETEMLKNLSHPNLPSIVDIIDHEDSILIVMDYVEGNTLSKAVNELGPQPQEYVIEWAKQLCDVLGYLHSQNPPIIYRDLKPGNIMLKPDGTIVLIDFGTAREYKVDNIEDTTCLGTRGYAAPEQFGGRGQTDARTDIYCLGTTIYHLVTGKNPSEPPYEIRNIRYWDESLSKGLEQIVAKCTQLDPEKRYQSCNEVLYALEHYDELDETYRRKEKVKLGIFLTTAFLTLAAGIGSFSCYSYSKYVQQVNHDKLLEDASRGATAADSKEALINSIAVYPSQVDSYINLIDNVYLSDENFSADEAAELREILIRTSGKSTYEQILAQDADSYSLFAYRLGLAYYYSYEGEGNKQQSAYWFKKAAEGNLNPNQMERAKRLGAIAEYYVNLGAVDKTGDSEVTYKNYWDDLVALCKGNITESDNANTALAIYKEMASQICVSANQFKKAGVSTSDMQLQLMNIEKHVKEDIDTASDKSERVVELEQELATNVEKAKQTISMLE